MRILKHKKTAVGAIICIFIGILFILTSMYYTSIFDREYDSNEIFDREYNEIEKISKLLEDKYLEDKYKDKNLSESINDIINTSNDSEDTEQIKKETSILITQKAEASSKSDNDILVNPIDFYKVHLINEDIIAWIVVSNKNINYPVLYASNEYYLKRKYDKSYSDSGSIFIEREYNSKSFDDPVTLIYGHQMKNETMFSDLAIFLNEQLNDDSIFMIYTENELQTYRIFAAVQYSEEHILYYNNFSDEKVFDSFFNEIFEARNFASNIDKSVDIKQGNIVILSTCFLGNSRKRFLVIGVCINKQSYFAEELK